MVFTSLPLYHLDPPNWNQQVPNQQQQQQAQLAAAPMINDSPHLGLIPIPPPPMSSGNGGAGNSSSSSRPGSMAERARLAKIPQPEPALKCPRCDSSNTKFCYFNNYSLSQPRHFCKTCRRYWTRGGALRSVPVGGGCRRNKRSSNKQSSTSSSANNKHSSSSAANSLSSSSSCNTATSACSSVIIPSNFSTQIPFLSSLHAARMDDQYSNLGLNFTALQHQHQQMDAAAGDCYNLQQIHGAGLEQWRIQQFPFLVGGGLGLQDTCSPAVNNGINYGNNFDAGDQAGPELLGFHIGPGMSNKRMATASAGGLITQMASVKMEDSQAHAQGLSLPRHYLGMPGNNNDQYGNNVGGWTTGDLSAFNSSSSSAAGNVL